METLIPAHHSRDPQPEDAEGSTGVEVLAVDFWPTLEGLCEPYRALLSTNGLDEVLARPLTVSVWEQARGFVAW